MNSRENRKDTGPFDPGGDELIACHECDLLHRIQPIPGGGKALCTRCGAFLYQNMPNSLERSLALNLAAFMLFVMANLFPFISLKAGGRIEENLFLSGALALYRLAWENWASWCFSQAFSSPY